MSYLNLTALQFLLSLCFSLTKKKTSITDYSLSTDFDYCGDRLKDDKVLYIQGKQGNLPNMDVDCDGIQLSPADDGRCGSSTDMQSVTSFADVLRSYSTDARDLDANIHPYVVFGNKGTREGYKTFDPRKYGIEPLSVMAVVCNNKLVCHVMYSRCLPSHLLLLSLSPVTSFNRFSLQNLAGVEEPEN